MPCSWEWLRWGKGREKPCKIHYSVGTTEPRGIWDIVALIGANEYLLHKRCLWVDALNACGSLPGALGGSERDVPGAGLWRRQRSHRGSPGSELQQWPTLWHTSSALMASVLLYTCAVLSVEAIDCGIEAFLPIASGSAWHISSLMSAVAAILRWKYKGIIVTCFSMDRL